MIDNSQIFICFFQAEDGIRDLVRSRGLGDVYKRQELLKIRVNRTGVSPESDGETTGVALEDLDVTDVFKKRCEQFQIPDAECSACLLYTSDAADERSSVDLGGRRIIKKKKKK